jgi:hypothetical protein
LLDFEKEDIANYAFNLASEIYDNYDVLNEEMAMEDDSDNKYPRF